MNLTFIRNLVKPLDSFDRLTLAYLAFLNALILFFPARLEFAPTFFVFHIMIGAACIALSNTARKAQSPAVQFLHAWTPLALFLFFFEELQYLVHLIHPGWFDTYLISFDYALFSAHPTVWLERFVSPTTNDAMQFAYMTYYFYAVILGALLYSQKDCRSLRMLMTASAAAYYIGYVISILFPIEGPFHTLAAFQSTELRGGLFTVLIGHIERFGRVHGAAFPSAHVSGSTVALLAAWHFGFRKIESPIRLLRRSASFQLARSLVESLCALRIETPFVGTHGKQNGGAQRLPFCRWPMRSPQTFRGTEHSRSEVEKSARWLFWIFLPFYLAMLVATVYGRYHYVADVLAGILTGLFGFQIGMQCFARRKSGDVLPYESNFAFSPATLPESVKFCACPPKEALPAAVRH